MENLTITDQEGNDLVKEYVKNNKLFAISRIGCGYETIVSSRMAFNQPVSQFEIERLCIQGGVYGNSINHFYEEYTNGIAAADIQVVWKGSWIDHLQKDLFNKFSKDSIKTGAAVVEPYYFDNPWSEELENKKVLVVNPLVHTMRYQFNKKRDKLWVNKNVLPEMDLLLYESVQSLGGVGPHSSWSESLNVMKDDISKLDFDFALLGCGTYGLPLLNHIKNNLNKSVVYVGGAVQIFFGIKGKRWDGDPHINKFYNDSWRRPFESEIPKYAQMVEDGCYW